MNAAAQALSAGLLGAALLAACTPAERADVQQDARTAAQRAEEGVEDAALTAAVKAKLLADTTVSGTSIDVDTRDSVVTLTGQVSSAAARARALEIARTTTGVTRVDDRLTTTP